MLFEKYLNGEINGRDARYELISRKFKKKKTIEERLDYLINSIDLYEKQLISSDVLEILEGIDEYIDELDLKDVFDKSTDVTQVTMEILSKFKSNKSEMNIIASLLILSIASRQPIDKAQRLISKARMLASRGVN